MPIATARAKKGSARPQSHRTLLGNVTATGRRESPLTAGGYDYWRKRLRTWFGSAFACASIAMPACCKTWARLSSAVSLAKSAS